MILTGDCGATNTIISLWDYSDLHKQPANVRKYKTSDYSNATDILNDFIRDNAKATSIKSACIGIAGPVINGISYMPNRPFSANENEIRELFGFSVHLVNDMILHCHSVPAVKGESVLQIKAPNHSCRKLTGLVIAPGTGLGQAFFLQRENTFSAHPSEASHRLVCSSDEMINNFLQYLSARNIEPVYDKVISGNGIMLMYEYYSGERITSEKPEDLINPGSIFNNACNMNDKVCKDAITLFFNLLYEYCMELALIFLPYAGIYLTGGIVRKNLKLVKDFFNENKFSQHPTMGYVLKNFEINLITDELASLRGGLHYLKMNNFI
ncbi:MAG: glucokinase [Ignavibacteriaceae bacterium]|jgi:Glucokinase|nr:MAG: hypothetical protein EDM69_06445 [Chlorobiota bacterium]KXK06345.1 MAG: glucokinase [Chlorobi bacterium OLB4]MBV6399142.1 Glucokinase [Ignavibacteria bacterium]MCC6885411.1 glucokinase [Ignavibacteriales bacterium]MCE7953654.1 hypothetical protein [Chlorobi bacterium CHB7]MDL1887457.1 hypothetical protein [Ignavibacteria bacterium CHB1]MEB2329930.1 glucokinase [Ignavibacteriaceae bacterium]OQY78344.1 MAG: hypothetical protein B6D43_02455 [Ignavibacteriales bacterium UTCHB1]RIK49162.